MKFFLPISMLPAVTVYSSTEKTCPQKYKYKTVKTQYSPDLHR